ncbi:hypothetical protein B0H11DRAFT_2283619, partial [Mycena galericulata]
PQRYAADYRSAASARFVNLATQRSSGKSIYLVLSGPRPITLTSCSLYSDCDN